MRSPEDDLFARFQKSGAPELLGRVYDLTAPELLHVALHLTGKPAEAEDVLQATFLAALERAAEWDPSRPVRPWLLGILRNQARRARDEARRRPEPERVEHATQPPPEQELERAELARLLDRALLSLPPIYQSVLILRLRHDLDPLAIAHALRRPPGTVRAQLARGLERLRRVLPASVAVGGALSARRLAMPGIEVRGHEAVRAAVVAQAESRLPWLVTLLGGSLVKKVALAASFSVVALVLPQLWARAAGPGRSDPLVEPVALAPAAAPRAPAEPVRLAGNASPAPLAHSVGPTAARGSSDEPAHGALRVRVRDAGAPAADAWVLVSLFREDSAYTERLAARTDARGLASLEGLPVGNASVQLLGGGQGGVRIRAGGTAELSLELLAALEVRGEVVDEAGRPVPGAEVLVSSPWDWSWAAPLARTDGMGRFRLSHVGPEQALGARAAGRASSFLQNPRPGPDGRAVVRLVLDTPGASVAGSVVDGRGLPVAGAEVLLGSERVSEHRRLTDGTMAFGPLPGRARTDEEGRFRIEGASPGRATLRVRRQGFAPLEREVEAGDQELLVTLGEGGSITGRVLDAGGTRGLGAVWIHAPGAGASGPRTWSRADGSFALADLPCGELELVCELEGEGRAARTFTIRAGDRLTWDVRLARPLAIHGTLLDPAGRPLSGWSVLASRGSSVVRRSGPSGADGAFRLAVPREASYTLLVDEPQGWQAFPHAIVHGVRPSEEPLVLRVGDGSSARLEATILGPGDVPAASARLTIWHEQERLWRSFGTDGRDGSVVVERVPPGTLRISIRDDEHPWRTLEPLRLAAGEERDLGVLRLADGWRLEGQLGGVDERLLEGVVLTIADEQGGEATGVERHGTRFRSGALAAGRYLLGARGDGVRTTSRGFEVTERGASELVLVLEPAGMREVVLRVAPSDGDQAAQENVWCLLRDDSGAVVWRGGGPLLEDELTLVVSGPPGLQRLECRSEGGLVAEAPLAIPSPGAVELPVELQLVPEGR